MIDESCTFENDRMVVSVATSVGDCNVMQDAYLVCLDSFVNKTTPDMFVVCDGHGPEGERVAKHICDNVEKITKTTFSRHPKEDAISCLRKVCLELDDQLFHAEFMMGMNKFVLGGSTCNMVLVGKENIYCCNVGDSRGIISVKGQAIPMSIDHSPMNFAEHTRIMNLGGYVEAGRVNGKLSVARAFGDFYFKNYDKKSPLNQLVTCVPDVCVIKRKDLDHIVVASDGVWDVLPNQKVVDYIVKGTKRGEALEDICVKLVEKCTANDPQMCCDFGFVSDNVTVLVAKILKSE